MIFKSVGIFGIFLNFGLILARGIRLGTDGGYVADDFKEVGNVGEVDGMNLLLEKVKLGNEPGIILDSSHHHHHPVDQENIGNDKRRKFVNGRNNHFQPTNITLEYAAGKDNGTWNVEKKEKMDLEREVKTPTPCQVTTEELVATAQSTVTKALKGLCNSQDMEKRFDDLENLITKELGALQNMILNLEDRLVEHENTVLYGQKQVSAAVSKGCTGSLNGNGGVIPSIIDLNNKNQKLSPTGSKLTPVPTGNGGHIDVSEDEEDVSGTRDPEILKFNSSIHMETSINGPPRKVFTYYWKIKDMKYKLTGWNPRKSQRSQSFYIFPSGYRMYMRIFPRQNEEKFLVRVGLTKGEFDDSLKWPFPLKHKVHILDQTKEGRLFEDIASRIWDPNLLCSDFNWQKPIKGDNHECIEIGFPHDVLKQREYIRKDALVIKLTVYLES